MRNEIAIHESLDSLDNELGIWETPNERGDIIYRMMKAHRYALTWALAVKPSQSNISERLDRAKRALLEISRCVPQLAGSWYIVSSYRDALAWLLDEETQSHHDSTSNVSLLVHRSHQKIREWNISSRIA